MNTLDSIRDRHLPALIDLRHRLHRIPELGYEEHKTAAAIREHLDRLGISHIGGVDGAPTTTVAVIGDAAKPCIALRADMDALPIAEQTGLPYASEHPGRMHACGHDGHCAALVGVAAVLNEMAERLPVCVKLIWQPAEEAGGGAQRLIAAGVLDGRVGPPVKAIFASHGWPGLKVGCVATRPGPMLAATDNFTATFHGQGCHGAYPHMGRDPIVAAAQAVVALQQVVSRDMDPTDGAVVTVGLFNAGVAVNIIPDAATFSGTARTLTEANRRKIRAAIERRCAGAAAGADCRLEFQWSQGYPAVNNDPAMADFVAEVARSTLGPDRFIPVAKPSMGGEDFSYYLEKVPGCIFLIGVEPADRNGYPVLHSDQYDFTDDALAVAIGMLVELAARFRA
jgi:amidohydrolase